MKKLILLVFTHAVVALIGFVGGMYALPILIAPPAPSEEEIRAAAEQAQFTGEFRRDLRDSDLLHWGEGTVTIGPDAVVLEGRLAPGPDYKLYFSPQFVETRADFLRLRDSMALVGDVNTFRNFLVPVPETIDPANYNSVIVWCEAFDQFITAARYQ